MNYLKLFAAAAFAIGAILYLASTDDHKVVMGEQAYDLGEFSKISVHTSASLKVRVGKDYGLNITGDEKDIKFLKIYVKGQTLVVQNKENFFDSWQGEAPEVEISVPHLKRFILNGTSDAEIRGVEGEHFKVIINGSGNIDFGGTAEELKVAINGSGDMKGKMTGVNQSSVEINGSGSIDLSGNCNKLNITVHGSGDFDGKKFECKQVNVRVDGVGDIEVYAKKSVDVDVMGSGEVTVYGNPKYVKDRSREKDHVIIR